MSLDLEVRLYRLIGGMLRTMVDGIPDDDFRTLPAGGGNSPNWILGHLVVANRMGLATLTGERSREMIDYMRKYGPGTTPSEDPGETLDKPDLVAAFDETADQLVAAIESATDAKLAERRDGPLLADELPTVRDILGHLLTTHLALHVGQLSAWRRGHGYDSVLEIPGR